MKKEDIDNILKSNKKLDWVKRLYEKDTPSIVLPGQEYPSTHYMESSDNLVYPTIIRNADGKLEYLGNKARDYAIKTNTAIKLDTEEDAAWFGENYKQGTDVLKEFKLGGNIMKKKKIRIPKYAPGGYMTTGDTVQLADSNMLQGYDSGLSSIPDYSQADGKQGANFGGIMQGIGAGTSAIGSMLPEDESKSNSANNANKMKDAVAKANIPFVSQFAGIDSMVSRAIPGKAGETVGGILNPVFQGLTNMNNKNLTAGQKFLNFLPFGNLALPEMDARFDKQFEAKNAGSNLNFGNTTQEIDNSTILKAALGGLVNSSSKDFKQFDAKPHINGGQFIDKNKNPTNDQNKAVAEIEKKENSYKDYIFSDTLLHKNEITFAKQADKINRKYKDREDAISKNSLDIELTELMKKNEKQRQLAEEQNQNLLAQVQEFALGGMLNKRRNVNSFNDMMDNSFYSPDGKFFTSQDQYQKFQDLYYPQENVPNLNPVINNYGKMKFKHNNFQFKNGGKIEPIYTDNPKDKGLKAYNDSLALYKLSKEQSDFLISTTSSDEYNKRFAYNKEKLAKYEKAWKGLEKINKESPNPENRGNPKKLDNGITVQPFMYKKPVQPVIYKKNNEITVTLDNGEKLKGKQLSPNKFIYFENNSNPVFVPTPKKKFTFPDEQVDNIVDENYKVPEVNQQQGSPLPDYLIQTVKTPNGMKTYKRKDNKSAWVEQYKNGGIIKKYDKGGSIKTPNPRNIKSIEYQEWLKKVPEEYRNEQNYYTGDLLDNKIVPTNKDIGTLDDYKTGEKLREDYIKKGIFLPRSQSGLINKFSYPFFEMNDKMKMGGKIKKYGNGGLDPSDPDYFTKLMQQQGVINNTEVPIPNMRFAYPEERTSVNIADITKDLTIPEIAPTDTTLPVLTQEKTKNKPSALEASGYAIKAAEMAGHLAQVMKKPDLVNPVYNPEENAIKGIMKNRSIDVQSILNELDLQEAGAKQNIANNSTSVGVMQANLQKLNANNVNAITKTKFDEQLQNNQYRADEATVLGSLGQQKVVAQNYAENLNAKAKGNVQNQRDKFLKESIGGLGDFLLKKDYVNKENQFQENILKAKGINFTPTSYKTWNKAGINIVEFAGELESESDKAKRETLKAENKKKYLAAGGTEASWNAEIHELENKYLTK